jgi:hypothetical protein
MDLGQNSLAHYTCRYFQSFLCGYEEKVVPWRYVCLLRDGFLHRGRRLWVFLVPLTPFLGNEASFVLVFGFCSQPLGICLWGFLGFLETSCNDLPFEALNELKNFHFPSLFCSNVYGLCILLPLL